jgi:hypothetical protein
MGHSFIESESNALYGYKTDLKKALREGKLSPGFRLKKGRNTGYGHSQSVQKLLERAQKQANDGFADTGIATLDLELVPDKVAEKIQISREDAQQKTGFHNANVRYQVYQLRVQVGKQGGIQKIQIGRDAHH